jgi:hypothetical protein
MQAVIFLVVYGHNEKNGSHVGIIPVAESIF